MTNFIFFVHICFYDFGGGGGGGGSRGLCKTMRSYQIIIFDQCALILIILFNCYSYHQEVINMLPVKYALH